MAIIIPCAGKSSRFPGTRPKFLLTMFDGKLMIEHAISPYIDTDQIHIIILSEHEEKYDARIALESIYNDNKNVHIHTLKQQTNGPAETVYSIAKKLYEEAAQYNCIRGLKYMADCYTKGECDTEINKAKAKIYIDNYMMSDRDAAKYCFAGEDM